MQHADFDGRNGYIEVVWDVETRRWVYRPVYVQAQAALTATELTALGLDAPLARPEVGAVPAFSQRDPRWANVRLGKSNYTMGSAGCAVTAAAMVAATVAPDTTPGTLVEALNANNGFTSGGLLYWSKITDVIPALRFVRYDLWRTIPAEIILLQAALSVCPQVIQVDFHPQTSGLDSHFVTALRMTDDDDVEIIDPWTGEAGTLLGMYGRSGWTVARAVYALAQFAV